MTGSLARLVLIAALILLGSAPAAAIDAPNIILIMPDDMGWGDIAAHGNPLIKTPSLDRLFAESIRFTDFHVSPTCSPTRSALMTGRHEFKNGVTHTILERERLTLKATTLAQVLKSAGYTTGIFGKWHLGDEEPYQPHNRGFDEVYIHGGGGIGQTYPGSCGDFPDNKYFDPALLHNGKVIKTKGYCTDLFFAQATNWINTRRQAGKPFFAYITPNAPHGPLVSPGPKYDALYEGREMGGTKLVEGDVAYYSMITNVDENIGKLLDKVNEWGLASNTLVIFLSDNGGTHTRLYSGGFRAGKGTVYHGGTHAPSFWRWPATLKGSADRSAVAAHIDVLPTLAEIVGVKLEGDLARQVEGRSLWPVLKDPSANWPDRTLVSHVGRWPIGKAAEAKYTNCSIRNTRYRLVNNRELYDLKTDPGETQNVIEQNPQVVASLRAAYDRWWNEVQPLLVNEDATGPPINPFKALYYKEFGGQPDAALLKIMDPTTRAAWGQKGAPSKSNKNKSP
jgi:arylsulfatase A-like enzyme